MKGIENNFFSNFLLLSCATLALTTRSFDILYESFRPEFNKNITETFTIALADIDKRQIINGSLIFAIDIEQFDLNLVFSIVPENGKNRKMIDVTLDGCNYLANGHHQGKQFTVSLMQFIRSSGQNLPTSCPIKKGFEIVVNKMYIDPSLLPPYFPTINFEVKFIMKYHKAIAYKVDVRGSIISKEKKKMMSKPF